jgi:hypothetical protein
MLYNCFYVFVFFKDPATGEYYPVVVQKHTMSSQFVFEGLSAGFLFVLGGNYFNFYS